MLVVAALVALWSVGIQESDDGTIRKLVDQLGADFLDERDAARKGLEKLGSKAETRLIEGLSSLDHRIRRNCLELLAAFKSQPSLDRAAVLFRTDEDVSVRDASFKLLQGLGKAAEDHLIAALESPTLEHRRGAIQTLAEIKSQRCAKEMASLHDREQDKDVKAAAFGCLQSMGKAAEPYLLGFLKSTDPVLRRDALNGLLQSEAPEVLEAVGQLFATETDGAVIDRAYEYLKKSKEKAQRHWLSGLKSPAEQGRLRAIEGLKELKVESAIGPVSTALENDPQDKVRQSAQEFLVSQGLKAEEPLIQALANANVKVRLLAIPALGSIKSEKPLTQIARLFREDKDRQVHRAAFEYLVKVGGRAEKELLAAVDDEDKEIKQQAVLALGNARSEASIDRLIDVLVWPDAKMKTAAMDALVRIGQKALEKVNAAVAAGRLNARAADGILALFYQEEVERFLDRLVTDKGGSGFYDGQFKELHQFGKEKALPVLLRMVSEPGYPYRLLDRRERVPSYDLRMRELAIMALGEFGDARAVEALKESLKEAGPIGGDSITEELLVALFRLGEKKPLDDYIRKAEADATAALKGEAKDDGCSLLFSLGLVLNRAGRREEAQAIYGRMVRAVEEHKLAESAEKVLPSGLYNLACLASLKGDKPQAVEWLGKAVRAGFKDRDWIKLDRDLDGIRGEEGYRALLADEKLFEVKKEE